MATPTFKYLLGIRNIGLAGDFIKTKQFGFVYWAELGDPNDELAQQIRETLNNILFFTYQSITLPDVSVDFAERRMHSGMYIVQPVSADPTAGEVTIEYIAPVGNYGQSGAQFERVLNYADEAFRKWQQGIILDPKTLILRNLHPASWQATLVYVLLRPDLREIWGGEILTGVVLTNYNGNYTFDAGTFNIRTVSATLRFLERIPIPTIINENNTSNDAALQLANEVDAHNNVKELLKQAIQHVLTKLPKLDFVMANNTPVVGA